MLKTSLLGFLLTTFIFPNGAFADSWQCIAHDNTYQEWTVEANYQRGALNNAMGDCKKESTQPSSCVVAKEDCDLLVNGLSVRPLWQCSALDAMALSWKSNIYRKADDAALAAKAYCKENSAYPETCYLYLFMCKNLNPFS